MSPFKNKNILVVLSGSIACYKAPPLISRFVKDGAKVKTITTESALKFLGEATLEGLTGEKNQSEIFSPGQMMNHIHLSRWADFILIYPASAHLIAKMAHGFADDLASCVFLARPKNLPVFVAPAMNQEMWSNALTKRNAQTLVDQGVRFVGPDFGAQACGEVGAGRLLEPDDTYNMLADFFQQQAATCGRVLITYGGTSEPIDPVRSIENTSTGETGRQLAESLTRCGWAVTVLKARKASAPEGVPQVADFTTFRDLEFHLQSTLATQPFDWVIQAAAVSDFSVQSVRTGEGVLFDGAQKIDSAQKITIELQQNPKLIAKIKTWSCNKATQVVGFKLTAGANEAEAKLKIDNLFRSADVDFVVHNDLSSIQAQVHGFQIFSRNQLVGQGQTKTELAAELQRVMRLKSSHQTTATQEVNV